MVIPAAAMADIVGEKPMVSIMTTMAEAMLARVRQGQVLGKAMALQMETVGGPETVHPTEVITVQAAAAGTAQPEAIVARVVSAMVARWQAMKN